MRLLLLALVLAAGCAKEPRQGASPPPPAPDAGADPCVAACVKDSQMRATSIEQIERECRATCQGARP